MALYSIPPLLTLICFVALTGLTLARWQNRAVNLLFLLICILCAGLYAEILYIFNASSARAALFATRLDHVFSLFLIPLYVHFFHAFLNIRGRKWLTAAFYAVPAGLLWFAQTPLLIESMHTYYFGYFGRAGKMYPLVAIPALCSMLYGGWVLGQAIFKTRDRALKRRLKYIFIGFVGIAGLTSLNFIPVYGYPLYPPGNFCFIPLLIFAVGLFRHDLLNMGLLIKKGLVYSILTAVLTGLYAIIVVTANSLLGEAGFSSTIIVPVLLFMVIAFVFGPLNLCVRKAVDRLFNRKQYDYRQVVRQNSRMIASVLNLHEIAGKLAQNIKVAMGVPLCRIYIKSGRNERTLLLTASPGEGVVECLIRLEPSHPLLEYFGAEQAVYRKRTGTMTRQVGANSEVDRFLDHHGAVMAVPMQFKGKLNGLIIAGEKESGGPFLPEDVDLLETLASHGALAVENAGAYQALIDLNRHLESRVVQRTRRLKIALGEKERALEQLVRTESLAAIGQLVAGVAHELNNPLASVKSLLQSVLEDIEQGTGPDGLDLELGDDLRFADQELDRAAGIVSSLLGLSRQTQTYREPVDVNAVLKAALRVLHNKYKHFDLRIKKAFAQPLPRIMGNFSNLGQVAFNIIENAIAALPGQKGRICLMTEHRMATNEVVFTCEDSGPGIPAAMRQEIFKPFFTTKPVGQGTGLGLYICHEIVSRHGGVIWVTDASGGGLRVTVRLPVKFNPAGDTASIDIDTARH